MRNNEVPAQLFPDNPVMNLQPSGVGRDPASPAAAQGRAVDGERHNLGQEIESNFTFVDANPASSTGVKWS